jgi:outer membrane protein assembly factor BamB
MMQRALSGKKQGEQQATVRFPRLAGVVLGAVLALTVTASVTRADDWPQWLGPQRDGVWRETGILETFPPGGPKIRWRTPVGMGYAGPAVAKGRVYLTDRMLAGGTKNPANAFARDVVNGTERVLCLDEATGKILWKHEYDCPYQVSYPAGPRTTPLVHDGKVYTLGTMGDLLCLDATTGKVLWSKNFPKDYGAPVPMWGFSANLLLEGDKLFSLVGGKGSVVVAFHKDSGNELWRALSAREIGYSPPMIFEAGGTRQLIIWHPDAVNGLDPETGKVYWTEPGYVQAGMSIATPRKAGDRLYVSSFYSGSILLQFASAKPAVNVVWKSKTWGAKSGSERPDKTDGLHCVLSTPVLVDGYIYGVCSYGQLRCVKADNDERIWETLKATGKVDKPDERWANAFLVPQGNRFFLANEKGDLIIARLTPQGYDEISRAHLLEPTNLMAGRPVVWSHPAFANKSVYARNDKEIICVSLAAEK